MSFRSVPNSIDQSINYMDLFGGRRMSLKVNRRCQWVTVSGVVRRHS